MSGRTTYRYFTEEDLEKDLDITSKPGDVIINFTTKEVISVNGFKYEGKIYYKANGIAY
ncbi:MAG: hypothetical protein HFJ54_02320 [Clostridia bacterium]|nr:hypothetical protein [Clostridia bacterium]